MLEVEVEGRIYNPLPMNPNSTVYPNYNPNILYIKREKSKRYSAYTLVKPLTAKDMIDGV